MRVCVCGGGAGGGAAADGALSLWSGFMPYYLRCGGHTVVMFISVEWLRGIYFGLAK